ncbi:MAG: histidine triad nucleotide-binding protein [Fimbriimonadales bacterium]|nr:histidine triad nucleotide-binding protein [Fimbriimonadales bacterium]
MSDCLFCKFARHEIPTQVVYEDEHAFAFRDINPQAPTHILIIPREHIESLAAMQPEHEGLMGHLLWVCAEIARREGIADEGYRVVLNTNRAAGQSVYHLHLHLLGGRTMHWPPG